MPEGADISESALPPYASSLPFDLHPRVDRASFHLRRPDWRAVYSAIAEAYGIRLLYDRDLGEPRLVSNFQVENVTLKQALEAAANISKTFVAPVDEHTGIVSPDTAQKRSEYERQILGNFQMDDLTTVQQLTEVGTALRTMLDLRRVSQDTRSNWISVLGRSRQVAVARQFVRGLQKERGEVMVDVDILEIDSQRARELGILPPQPIQLVYLGLAAALPTVSVLTFGSGRTLYGLNLPGASAPLTFSSSVVRSLQQLQLRASDGQQATLLLGERFPLLNGIISSSFFVQQGSQAPTSSANLGFYPSIQYEDLGVSVKATPYLHAGRELTLKFDLSLRNVGGQSLNGAPIISNRQVAEQVRMRDGENYLISGIMNRSDQASITSGYPWLSRLPLLGVLFGGRNKQRTQTEFLMLIRPHIVRASPAEEYAFGPIYFGKELQGLPAEAPLPPAPVIQPPPAPGVPPQPGVVPQPGIPPQPGAPGVVPFPGAPPGFVQPFPPGPGGQPQNIPPQAAPPFGVFPPGIVPPNPPQPAQR